MAPEPFRNQRYKDLKKQLIKEGKLFTDPEFPPAASSIYFDPNRAAGIEWKRPGDIENDPKLFVDGISVDDVEQGELGNCWFVAACSTLTHDPNMLNKVIPNGSEQEWSKSQPERYCGIFHFCFWRFGRWVDVVVDDLLPTRDGELIFAHSKAKNEFWSALLEKAFAKLHGCYESLTGGTLGEAFVDITGGVPETINLDLPTVQSDEATRLELFTILKGAFDDHALIAAAITAKTAEENEQQLESGLVKGHLYAVTAIKRLSLDAQYTGLLSTLFSTPEKVLMVRFQNPWGEKEWNGAWSDGAPEWNQISKNQKEELGLRVEEDGQFWMNWEDVCRNFTVISVCHQLKTGFFALQKRYFESVFQGLWQAAPTRGHFTDRAGGCINFRATCLCNPQYRFDITDDVSEVLMTLQQRDIRERRRQGASFLTIGIMLFHVEQNRVYRLHQLLEVKGVSEYTNSRSVFLRGKNLRRGRYVVIPSTYAPGEEGEFMVRLYSRSPLNAHELTKDRPKRSFWSCLTMKRYTCVTRFRIISGEGLHINGTNANPYCIVKCESETVRSNVCKDTLNPQWDFLLIFIRRYVDKPITIDVWSSNLLKDTFVGRVVVDCPVLNDSKRMTLPLGPKSKKTSEQADAAHLGSISLEIATYDNPEHL